MFSVYVFSVTEMFRAPNFDMVALAEVMTIMRQKKQELENLKEDIQERLGAAMLAQDSDDDNIMSDQMQRTDKVSLEKITKGNFGFSFGCKRNQERSKRSNQTHQRARNQRK